MKSTERNFSLQILGLVIAMLSLTMAADAANLTVTVSRPGSGGNKGNPPIAGALVCYRKSDNTSADNKTTDSQGRAVFNNVPPGQLNITVTASGFIGQSSQLTMTSSDASTSFLLQAGSGGPVCDTSPPITPRDNVGTGVILQAELRLNAGAASAKGRLASLNFTARQTVGATTTDVTASVTHFRARESPDLQPASLSAQPWIPLPSPLILELALRNGLGQRYGERRVMFQVKIGTWESNVTSDTITLEPVIKEYRVSPPASGNHPLIQYAASQGFQFPLDFYETCNGNCAGSNSADSNIASGHAAVVRQGLSQSSSAPLLPPPASASAGTCTTKTDYLLFEGRSPNQFWHIKSVAVPGTQVVTHGLDRFRVKLNYQNTDGSCLPPLQISIGEVTLEGPEVDDFIDPANPWKNAFVRQP